MSHTDFEQRRLLLIARRALEHHLGATPALEDAKPIPPSLLAKGACFVTLRQNRDDLRGCIGTVFPTRSLAADVRKNALAAAMEDPRFDPLSPLELPKIKISISVLSRPKPIRVKDAGDLFSKLEPGRHGLIIREGTKAALFLPSVWRELKGKGEFLTHLCLKAGLAPDRWRSTDSMSFSIFEAEEFGEK